MRRALFNIYHSRRHVLATFILVALPFLFFILFTHFTEVAGAPLALGITASLARMAAAYFLAAFLGWLCAVLFYRGVVGTVALPIFDVFQSIPTFAALPIAVNYLGANNLVVIIFLILAIIWPVFFSVVSSLKLIKRDWQEAVVMAGLSPWDYVRKFLWPASLPGLITGSIVGLGDGWEALIATEIIVNIPRGMGNFFQAFSQNVRITLFGMLGFLFIIFAINKILWLPLLEWSHRQMEE